MASKRKPVVKTQEGMAHIEQEQEQEQKIVETEQEAVDTQVVEPVEEIKAEEPKTIKPKKSADKSADKSAHQIKPRFEVGDIAFISKDAEADLNGFKLFPQYKKYTYTVEAYDASEDIYTLRRLNLSLRLKGELLMAPNERAHDSLNRKQF